MNLSIDISPINEIIAADEYGDVHSLDDFTAITFPSAIIGTRNSSSEEKLEIHLFQNEQQRKIMLNDFPADSQFYSISISTSNTQEYADGMSAEMYERNLQEMRLYLHELFEHLRKYENKQIPIEGLWLDETINIFKHMNSRYTYFWMHAEFEHKVFAAAFGVMNDFFKQVGALGNESGHDELNNRSVQMTQQLKDKHLHMASIAYQLS